MKIKCSLFVSGVRLLWSSIASQIYYLFLKGNLSLIWLFFKPSMMRHAFVSIFVVVLAVCSILAIGGLPEICKSVIGAIAIFMINQGIRPLLRHIKPSKPVGGIVLSKKLNAAISFSMNVSSLFAHANFGARHSPSENARVRVIMQDADEVFMRYFFHKPSLSLFTST